jgi:DNA-binding HxlR family transcriptional regulator
MSRASGAPPETTLRTRLKGLEGDGLVVKRGRDGSPGIAEHALTESGEALLIVIASLERWLGQMPEGPLLLDGPAGKAAIKSFSESWSSMVLHGVAAGPISLSGLANELRGVTYPAIERRLSAMRRAGQIEVRPNGAKGTPYVVTEWMQRSVVPLATAVRWEQAHLSGAPQPMSRIEVDTAFLLALPLLRVEVGMSGSCRMDVRMDDGGKGPAGANAVVAKGRVVSCAANQKDSSDAWATGSQTHWAATLTSRSMGRLRFGGDQPLTKALIGDLRLLLFPAESQSS